MVHVCNVTIYNYMLHVVKEYGVYHVLNQTDLDNTKMKSITVSSIRLVIECFILIKIPMI